MGFMIKAHISCTEKHGNRQIIEITITSVDLLTDIAEKP